MKSKITTSFLKFTKKKSRTIIRISIKVLVAAAVLASLFILASLKLSEIALKQIGELTNTKLTTDTLKLSLNGSVAIRNLVIRPNESADYDNTILRAKKVRAYFKTRSILLFRPRLKRIIISEFDFNIVYDSRNDQWNLGGLKKIRPKSGSGKVPKIFLNEGTLLYTKISEERSKRIAEIGFNLRLLPALFIDKPMEEAGQDESEKVYNFGIHTSQWSKFGKINLYGQWYPGRIKLVGEMEPAEETKPDVLSARKIKASLDYSENKEYSLRLDISDFESKKEAVDEHFKILRSLFPMKLGAFETLQDIFDRFRPGGLIDLAIEFSGNLGSLNESQLTGKVYCKDVWLCDKKFNYPVSKLIGRIDVSEKGATLHNLRGRHGDVELCFNGWTKKSNGEQLHDFEITSNNMILDEDLYKALKAQQQKVWDDFSPAGMVTIKQNVKKVPGRRSSVLTIGLLNTSARWSHFPYPLKNLSGELFFDSNKITFTDVVSKSDKERIIINGKVISYNSSNPLYDIKIEAEEVDPVFIQTEEYTKHIEVLMPDYVLKTINELQITGNVNFTAHMENKAGKGSLDYDIDIECLGNYIDYAPISYPLRDVTGRMKLTNEAIQLKDVKGRPAEGIQITESRSNIKIDGQIGMKNNRFSNAVLRIRAERINLDEGLGAALPKQLSKIYFDTSPTGLCDVNFSKVRIFTTSDDSKYIGFEGSIEFDGCNFNISPAITELNGTLQIEGLYKSGYGFLEGHSELKGFSGRIKDKLLTKLKANVVYDNKLKLWQSTQMTCRCYDGTVAGRFALRTEPGGAYYVLDAGFYDINLKQFLSDPYRYQGQGETAGQITGKGKPDYSQGNMDGSLSIKSTIGSEGERTGRCRLAITDMRVGKLSPIAKLLYVLKPTEAKDFAFEQMAVDSYIRNNNLFLKKVDISGEAIAFNGLGHLDLEELNIDLILTARGRRLAGAKPGVLQSLTEGLGQGIVRMDVTGNIYDPKVITETLPVIKGALHLLGTKKDKSH